MIVSIENPDKESSVGSVCISCEDSPAELRVVGDEAVPDSKAEEKEEPKKHESFLMEEYERFKEALHIFQTTYFIIGAMAFCTLYILKVPMPIGAFLLWFLTSYLFIFGILELMKVRKLLEIDQKRKDESQ